MKTNIATIAESKRTRQVKTAVDVIDAAGGNIGSLCRALERLEIPYQRVGTEHPIGGERPIILPGVGAFGSVMEKLTSNGLDTQLKKQLEAGTPFLGICVGLQVLFEQSEESPDVPGLSVLGGKIVRFSAGKVPQIGWNCIDSRDPSWSSGYAYFVNSFYAQPAEEDDTLFQSQYFETFCAGIKRDNVTAFQFHPEKSGDYGLSLLKRWIDDAGK